MSCPAKGSRTQVVVIEESTFGVVPTITAGDTQVLPRSSVAINLTKDTFEDPSVSADGQDRFVRHGNKQVGGDISVAYAHETYDLLLENLFQNEFTSDVLKLGNMSKSLTIGVEHQDKSIQFVHSGLRGSSFSMEVNTSGIVSASFSFLGKDTDASNSTLDSSPTAAPNKQPFTHIGGVFKEGGSVSGVITGVSVSIDNQMDANFALGEDTAICVSNSEIKVEGSITAWFQNLALYNKFLNETESSVEFELEDGRGNSHTWKFPKVKFNAADVPVSDGGPLTITLPFVALYDGTAGTSVQITRS